MISALKGINNHATSPGTIHRGRLEIMSLPSYSIYASFHGKRDKPCGTLFYLEIVDALHLQDNNIKVIIGMMMRKTFKQGYRELHRLLKNVLFIIVNLEVSEKIEILMPECLSSMVFFLILNIPVDCVHH